MEFFINLKNIYHSAPHFIASIDQFDLVISQVYLLHKHEVVVTAGSVIVVSSLLAVTLDLVGLLLLVGAEDEQEDREQDEAVIEAEYHS